MFPSWRPCFQVNFPVSKSTPLFPNYFCFQINIFVSKLSFQVNYYRDFLAVTFPIFCLRSFVHSTTHSCNSSFCNFEMSNRPVPITVVELLTALPLKNPLSIKSYGGYLQGQMRSKKVNSISKKSRILAEVNLNPMILFYSKCVYKQKMKTCIENALIATSSEIQV